MDNGRTALVLGATGGIGGEAARALLRRGWRVVAMARDPDAARRRLGTDALAGAAWVGGDAMNAPDVARAATGAAVIVHAVNPPGYRDWGRLVLPMIDNSIAAAKDAGARIVLPGTVYNYGPDAFPVLREDSPQHPRSEKGRIRVELERRLEEAAVAGAPALIVRFGDFFGAGAANNWFAQGLVKPNRRLDAITDPGGRGVGHAWAYLPDAGEAIARLLDRSGELEPFARFHFGGVWDADGRAMIHAIARAVGRPDTRVKALPWPLVGLAGVFGQTPREVFRMRYLWRTPLRLDNRRLVAFLGDEPHTKVDDAVRTTLAALNID